MNLAEAKLKLEKYGQEQLLKYYDELTEAEQDALIEEICATDFDMVEKCKHKDEINVRGVITPTEVTQLAEINKNRDSFYKTGAEALRAGKVAAVLLAGGMGTRLGSDNPKGMYNVGITHELYIFECQIKTMLKVVEDTGAWFHFFIMTSDKNNDATIAFLKEHNFFGYKEEYVHFFKQEMAPASDYNGKIYLEGKGKLSTSPNGNGGWFISLVKAGLMDVVKENGIEWFNIYAVDNVLQKICDPAFIGATLQSGAECGAKVVKKAAPDEKVGAMCLEDGRPSIVEYYDMTQELMDAKDANGEPAYNFGVILNYLFNIKALEKMVGNLPLHIVEKKIPYLDENGNLVKPESPNGYKFENLVLDMIHQMASCCTFEVERNHEFAPIKNKTGIDSVESARALLQENGVVL